MRPFFSFYGSKFSSSCYYPDPKHDIIIEPFAGSAGYSVSRAKNRKVLLFDKDPTIVQIWKYLISVSEEEILSLPDIENDQTIDDLNICESAKLLIGFWLNKATSHPRKKPSSWMKSGHESYQFWSKNKRLMISKQLKNIRNWEIIQGDYSDVKNINATWFIDPPYIDKGKYYKFGSKKINYNHLSEWCRSLNGQVIVCEQKGADWLPFREFKKVKSANHNYSQEVIWTKECEIQQSLF